MCDSVSCRILLPHDSDVSFLPNCDYCVVTPLSFQDSHLRCFQYLSTIYFTLYFMPNLTHLLACFYHEPIGLNIDAKLLMRPHPCRHNFSLTSQLLNYPSNSTPTAVYPYSDTFCACSGSPSILGHGPCGIIPLCLYWIRCHVFWV